MYEKEIQYTTPFFRWYYLPNMPGCRSESRPMGKAYVQH